MKYSLLDYCAAAKRRLFREGGRWALLIAVLLAIYSSANGQVTVELKTPGAGTWTVPAGVTEVTVEAWGGGGCGASSPSAGGKAGGGGGAYARSKLTVVPGDMVSYEVGAGSATTDPGGDSWFFNTASLKAAGGTSSVAANFGGAGGNSADCIGNEAVFSGGSGSNRGSSGQYRDGGGGGSAAGTAANGNAATNYIGAAAPTGGGNGGNSKSTQTDMYVDAPGQAGQSPGGGGGGGYSASFASVPGGKGGDGMIRITYSAPAAPEIKIVSSNPSSLCPNIKQDVTISFTPSGFSGAQVFTVELSDATGSFASPVAIGTGSSSPLTAAIPGGALTTGGNYKIRVVRYHANGNIFSDDLDISLLTPPAVTVGTNPSVCIGTATAALPYSNATGNPDQYSIAWGTSAANAGFQDVTNASLPSGAININVPSGATANTYSGTLTVRNSSTGCVSTGYNISIVANGRPEINSVTDLSLCFGSVTQLALPYTSTGAAGNFSIEWKTKAANAGFTDIVKGVLWGSPLGVSIPQNTAPDVYTGTMTIENGITGCVSEGYDFNITINPLPTITLGANPSVCAGVTSTSLTYTGVTNSPDQYSIAWEVPAGIAGFSTVTDASFPSGGAPIPVPVPANVAPGTYDGRLYIKNTSTKCQGSGYQTFRVEVIARPSVTLGSNPTVCVGASSASLTYSGATGTPGQYSITWDAAAVSDGFAHVTNAALPSGSINIAVPGTATQNTYTGKLTVRNTTTGCVSEEYNIGVTVVNLPVLSIGAAPSVCAGVTGASLPYTATGSPDQYNISWGTAATGEGFANVVNAALSGSSVNLAIPAGTTPGTYTGSMTVRNSLAGCSGSAQNISVTVHARPVVTLSATSPVSLCTGGDTLLTANTGPGYSYEWKDDFGVVGSGISYTASATGFYYVVVTDGNNCRDSSDFVTVTVYPTPVVSIVPGDTAFCEGATVRFEAQTSETGLAYLWKNGGATLPGTDDFIDVSASGDYYVVAERSAVPGCMDSSNVATVTVHPLPSVSIRRDGEKLYTDDWYVSYQWLTSGQPVPGADADGPVFEPAGDGDYSVQVTDSNGCVSTSPVEEVRVGVSKVSTSAIRVYPNPASGMLYIESAGFVNLGLYDMEGRLLGRYQGLHLSIDVSDLPEGVYILSIMDEHGTFIRKEQFIRSGSR